MCPANWQTQYDLTEKRIPVNTRALLLIHEKIENNAEVKTKPPSLTKPKGAEGNCRMESIDYYIPKKSKQVGFSNKQYALCKKHSRPHKLHNTCDYRRYNPDGTPIKRDGGAGSAQRKGNAAKHHSNQREHKVANFAQIICKEVNKSFCKQLHKHKKHCMTDSESNSDSDYSS
jgi:hypothetical protein